jgi:hypothetical protein
MGRNIVNGELHDCSLLTIKLAVRAFFVAINGETGRFIVQTQNGTVSVSEVEITPGQMRMLTC